MTGRRGWAPLRGPARAIILGWVLWSPGVASAQSRSVELSVGGGLNVPWSAPRFEGTDPGYVVEGAVDVSLGGPWFVGLGWEWSTFGGDVPEFAVFAPLDHAAWIENSMTYVRVRRLLGSPSTPLRPVLEGRLGWVSELAEYSGATIRRAGPSTGGAAGVRWALGLRTSVHVTGSIIAARLGDGSLMGLGGAAPASLAMYGKLIARLAVRIAG